VFVIRGADKGLFLMQVLQHEASSPPGSARNALNAAAMAAAALAHSAGLQFPTHTLACIYCTKDGFTSMEQLQLHVQAMHGKRNLSNF